MPDYTLDRIDNGGDYAPGNVPLGYYGDSADAKSPPPMRLAQQETKAAGRAAKRDAFLAANGVCQRRFDEEYLQAVMEQESEIASVNLIDWQVSKTR